MTHPTRRSFLVVSVAVLAVLVAACDPSPATPTPSASASPSPAASVALSSPPSVAPATPAPAGTPAPSAACVFFPQFGKLPSDRFTGLKVTAGPDTDQLTFQFGESSLGPGGPPEGSMDAAEPPYTQGASGATIEVNGDHVVTVVFRGMSLSNDVGQETYAGPTDVKPDLPGLRHAVLYDASEGVIGWYVGYNGGGCPTLTQTTDEVTLTIQHP